MNNIKKNYLRGTLAICALVATLGAFPLVAQRGMLVPDSIKKNFYKEVEMREKYWDTIGLDRRKGEYKQYSRWKAFWELRVMPDGSYPDASIFYNAFKTAAQEQVKMKSNKFQAGQTWQELGPNTNPEGPLNQGGVGRLNVVRVHPMDPNEIWVGAAQGGAWRSKDGGASWTPLYQTEFLSLGVSDIAICPSSPLTIYVATGDFDGSLANNACYSIGILKSTDGGETWQTTQNAYTLPENKIVSRLWVHPEDANIIIAATGSGIIKSMDGGATWNTKVGNGRFSDLEQMPGEPNVLYGSTMVSSSSSSSQTFLMRSQDMGENWETVRTFTGGARRTCLAVTPAAPANLYALTAGELGGFHSFVISDNNGTDWEETNIYSPQAKNNYLTHTPYSNLTSGQGWYDLALAVSPTDPSTIFLGGVNIYRSTDRGKQFSIVAHWQGQYSAPYVHADIHDLYFVGNTLYSAHDGGIDKTTDNGASWKQLYNGLGIAQIYSFDVSQQNPEKMVIGLQDLGSRVKITNWEYASGGDGMQCYFDPQNDEIYYTSVYNGTVYKNNNDQQAWIISPSIVENRFGAVDSGAWVTAFAISPQNPEKIYVGYSNIYYSGNAGVSWSKQTQLSYNSSTTIRNIRICATDDKIVYAHTLRGITYTTNGSSWSGINLPPVAQNISSLEIHPDNPNVIYVTFSGYAQENKLFKYDGTEWTNLTGNLPNVPANCVAVHVENGLTKLYIGTDIGVYYGVDDVPYYNEWGVGLPNLSINELAIVPSIGKIRAATYGRGIWEVSLNECNTLEHIEIAVDGEAEFCSNDSVRLYINTADQSDIIWSNGKTGNEIWVNDDNTYWAVSNASSDCFKTSNKIVTTTKLARTLNLNHTDSVSFCVGDSASLSINSVAGFQNIKWNTGETERIIYIKEPGEYFVEAETMATGCISKSRVIRAYTFPKPDKPAITYILFDSTAEGNEDAEAVDTLEASEGARYQWYKNGNPIYGNEGIQRRLMLTVSTTSNYGEYTVAVSNEGDCYSEQSDLFDFHGILEEKGAYFQVSPKPATDNVILQLDEKHWGEYTVTLLNMQGAIVKTIDKLAINNTATSINIADLAAGSYVVKLISATNSFSDVIIKVEK